MNGFEIKRVKRIRFPIDIQVSVIAYSSIIKSSSMPGGPGCHQSGGSCTNVETIGAGAPAPAPARAPALIYSTRTESRSHLYHSLLRGYSMDTFKVDIIYLYYNTTVDDENYP